jgi:acetyl esterase
MSDEPVSPAARRAADPALARWLDGHDPRAKPPGPRLPMVRDGRLDSGCAVRRYTPPDRRGTVLFAHGGGWVKGDLDSHDRLCRLLAAGTGAEVVAVDYRRAPRHPWPAAVDDVVEAIAAERGSVRGAGIAGPAGVAGPAGAAGALVLAGDSAGGTIATLACLAVARAGGPAASGLALACPNTDLTLGQPSITAFGDGFSLDADALEEFVAAWVPDPSARRRGDVSPLYSQELGLLPPTHVATAELDPLGDEGRALARRLAEEGVLAGHSDEPGLVHGFVMLDYISPAAARATGRWITATAALLDSSAGM